MSEALRGTLWNSGRWRQEQVLRETETGVQRRAAHKFPGLCRLQCQFDLIQFLMSVQVQRKALAPRQGAKMRKFVFCKQIVA